MKTFSSAVAVLLLNTFYAFSEIQHEVVYLVGCFENGTTEAQYTFDAQEVLHVDFKREEIVYTVPKFIVLEPQEMFKNMHLYRNALKNRRACEVIVALEEKDEMIPDVKDPPESVLYPSEDVELGVENSLVCFVNHFFPPDINVHWTKNGHPVLKGVSLNQYYPNNDQTFHLFSTLTFTPEEGDIYGCTVEHSALESPTTRIWEPDFSHQSLGLNIYCGVGLTVGLFGIAAGVFLIAKAKYGP
ncbi:H-2 class II histocompatibility antigen, A-U alpha chain-like [Scomber japonicus]|uniref:H-2 class II histocompatibility antigen, A-U alpha chain-like n=1 Tax=Scomber japonicus TaxID=13676 RepID=UPI002305BB35|nr:H-2 class II histocompatibility antigen, A-U alpha chain-like [Scomber japonicus]